MKTLATNVLFELSGQKYICDVLLGLYANTERAAILLVETRPIDLPGEQAWAGEPIAVATSNCPPEYIQHLDHSYTVVKNWSENTGILPQLLSIETTFETPLFLLSPHKITLGFCTAPIIQLGPLALALLRELRKERKETNHG